MGDAGFCVFVGCRRWVVGVIVSGQSWQFKGWKWKFPLEVFKKGWCD